MAWARSAADVDRRSNNPRQDIKARQSLPARPVRAGGVGRADQAEELGAPWAQALDRGGQKAAASQRPCDCARQQTGAHRVERSCSRPCLRGEDDRRRRCRPTASSVLAFKTAFACLATLASCARSEPLFVTSWVTIR